MKGKIFFVGTPIGNLKDITFRAVETLKSVDEILCEDTRSSLKLLNFYDIKKPLSSFHKFNYKTATPRVIEKLLDGKNLALITDAGMPCISDPGSELINSLVQNKIEYTVIPGACAFVNAVALVGLSTPFSFVGFLPDNKKDEKKVLEKLKSENQSLIFYVAPHKLISTLENIKNFFGNRDCITVREITKIHEEIEYFNLEAGYPKEPRGEYVLIVKPPVFNEQNELLNLSILEHFNFYKKMGMEKNEAIKKVAKERNVPKNEIYMKIIEKN